MSWFCLYKEVFLVFVFVAFLAPLGRWQADQREARQALIF
jgi:cytochrome oxidase assembly protein ShyY1